MHNVLHDISLNNDTCQKQRLSLSLSATLTKIEKVEQYIRKKIHKLNVLIFWVESDVIFLI